MRKELSSRLHANLSGYFEKLRYEMNLTQEKMAEVLMMDKRSYADIAHNKSLPSFLTFVLLMSALDEETQRTLLNRIFSVIEDFKNDDTISF